MRTFTLKATYKTTSRTHTFQASTDDDAIGVAAMRVVTLAYPNIQPWASGKIELINDMDVVLAEMAEAQ